MTIADAPWIRDAENNGWGPEDDDLDYADQIECLKKVEELLDEASGYLQEIVYELGVAIFEELFDKVNDMAADVRVVKGELERGHIA